jgi:hypothetical protein
MTNPTLLRAVRERMAAQTTEQLLDLWVTNDRATWSPEAFEAVKQILAERGRTELPPQNDPAPVAGHFKPTHTADAQYWLGWLRPVIWIAIVVAALMIIRAPLTVWTLGRTIWRPLSTTWTLGQLVVPVLTDVVLPGWLLIGAIGCLLLRPWARLMLMWYPLGILAFGLWATIQNVEREPLDQAAGAWLMVVSIARHLERLVQAMVLPIVLALLLRRPEIQTLFRPPRSCFQVDMNPPV